MKKTLIFLGALVFSTSTIAGHHAPEASPGVLEAWECSYNTGKDLADLMSARDFLVKQADKDNITLEPSFVWSQYKGDAPIDFVWFTAHSNLLHNSLLIIVRTCSQMPTTYRPLCNIAHLNRSLEACFANTKCI